MKNINLRIVVIIGLLVALVVTPFLWARTHPRSLTPMQIAQRDASMPPYQHIFVIIAENRGFNSIMDHPNWTPVLHRLGAEYGMATQFYGEVHPSEAAYVAMLGGDTFGIHDDNPWYCRAGSDARGCNNSHEVNYADHSLSTRNLTDQLEEQGLSWKAYMEDVPANRLAPYWPSVNQPSMGLPNALYASKHNGFLNFRSVSRRSGEELARRIVGFQQLAADLAHDTMPNYAHIIPNQCNEMHGLRGANVPPDCDTSNGAALVRRGDAQIGKLVEQNHPFKGLDGPRQCGDRHYVRRKRRRQAEVGCPRLLRVRSEQRGEFRRWSYTDAGHHQPRTATCRQLNPVQPLFTAAHDGGRLRHQGVSGASRRHPAGRSDHDSAVRR